MSRRDKTMKKILRKIKRLIKSLLGKDFFIKEQININKVTHGGEADMGAGISLRMILIVHQLFIL